MLNSFTVVLGLISFALAKTVTYDFSIDFVTAAPDGFSRQVIGINGKWPCPAIEANVGDTVIVNVKNNLGTQSTGLHFHGLDQRGTQFMDGPSGVTQCPIPPGSSFTYKFNIDRAGTYWYHSHNKGQYPDGLRGPLIVHDPHDPYKRDYDEELVLTMSDWYHTAVPPLIAQMLVPTNPRALPPFPNALLLNDGQNVKWNFIPGKTYKIRMISMAAFASILVQFDSHTMQVIEIDGSYVQKQSAFQLRLSPAQRYTVLLTAKSNPLRNYPFLASLDMNRDFAHDPAPVWPFNLTGSITYDEQKAAPSPYVVAKWRPYDDATLKSLDCQPIFGARDKVDKDIRLDFKFGLDSHGIPRTYFNNITYVHQKVPSLFTAISTGKENANPAIYGTVNPFVVKKDDIVQIVVNNLDGAIHPFHLHGHQFQLLERPASGKGSYKGQGRNFPDNPPRRDTVSVNAGSYAVIRFKADNPGVWLFHCHIEWHVVMGLTATIIEAPEHLRGLSIPSDHKAACAVQGIPIAGNAAGRTANLTDMTGALTEPDVTDPGAIYPRASENFLKTRSKLSRRAREFALDQGL